MGFKREDIPDLSGKVALITGCSPGGLGHESALRLAEKGCEVVMTCKNDTKGNAALDSVKQVARDPSKVHLLSLDLSSLDSVRACADEFKALDLPLHILLNNAGIMHTSYASINGVEDQFAVNHLGHFLLTKLLCDKLVESQPSRIVNVSSSLHKDCPNGGLLFDDINWEKHTPDKYARYGHSKASNIIFTKELASRLNTKGITQVYVNSIHPGFVDTNLTRYHRELGIFSGIFIKGMKFFNGALNVHTGALTQLFACTSPEIEANNIKGQFFVPIAKPSGFDGPLAKFSEQDWKNQQQKLWELSENLCGEQFEI